MNKQEIEGAAEKVAGKVKEAVGKATNSPITVAKGKAEQVAGEVKKQSGKLKEQYRDSQAI
jgi:uncharacterized protein YjbJ (UPF0337 family)